MFIWHSVLVLVQKAFSFILHIMGIVSNGEGIVGESWLLEIILVFWSGKVGIQLLTKALI